MYRRRMIFYLLLLYTISIIFVGCNNSGDKTQDEALQEMGKKQIPATLDQMAENTEKLIRYLWHNQEEGKDEHNLFQPENGAEDDNNVHTQPQDEEKDNTDEPDQNTQEDSQQQTRGNNQQPSLSDSEQNTTDFQSWSDIKKGVEKLHIDWNIYEPEAREDGATDEMIAGFKEQLNILSERVETQQPYEILQEANSLYAHYPKFFNLYQHYAPPEIKHMKAITRQMVLDAQNRSWESMEGLSANLKNIWLTAKSRMDDPDISLNQRIDYAIDDLIDVASQQRDYLTRLKGNILLQNLEQVKK